MKRHLLWASLFLLWQPSGYADEQQLGQDCDQVERVLLSVPGAKYSRDWSVFQGNDGESVYGGCVMVVTGSRTDGSDIKSRLNQLYPTDDNEFGKSGWALEGPTGDNQTFTMIRNGNFCQVSGDWETSNSTDSKTGSSNDYTVRVECGVKDE